MARRVLRRGSAASRTAAWPVAHRGVALPRRRRAPILRWMVDEIIEGQLLCTLCGSPLGYNIDDRPDWPTGPMCGDCYQARETDNDMWAAELNDDDDL